MMRVCAFAGVAAGCILLVGALRGDPARKAETDRVAHLIRQLGDEVFATREAAARELTAIGLPALKALQLAATTSTDAEVRARCQRLAEAIEETRPFTGKDLAGWVTHPAGSLDRWG